MQNRIRSVAAVLSFGSAFGWALTAGAVVVDQVDDFEDGTEQDWGGGNSPANMPTGGPVGAGDNFLSLDSQGFVLGTFNQTQWSGDYVAAGVASVQLDAINDGPDPVSLRLMVFTAGCGPGQLSCTAWASLEAAELPSGSGWQTVEFSLAEADMVQVVGTDSLPTAFANVQRILLRHDAGVPSPPGSGEIVDALLGIDNVTALPEPATGSGLAAGGLLLLGLARGRRVVRAAGAVARA